MPILNTVEDKTKEALFIDLKVTYDSLRSYNIIGDYECIDIDDNYYPLSPAVMIPFDSSYIVVAINGLNETGNLTYDIKGKTSLLNLENEIIVCNLFFLDDDCIHYKVVDIFEIISPAKDQFQNDKGGIIKTFLCDNKFISTVIHRLFNYYCTDRYLYHTFGETEEKIELEL